MAIDRDKETLVALSEGKKLVRQRPPSYDALRRWADHGLRGERKQRVFLDVIKIGGVTYTSVEAFERFLGELNGHGAATPAAQ